MRDANGEERKGIEVWHAFCGMCVPVSVEFIMDVADCFHKGERLYPKEKLIRDLMLAGF